MTVRRTAFALVPAEVGALDTAYTEFLRWDIAPGGVTFEGSEHRPPRLANPKLMAKVRSAAREFHKALHPFFDGPAEQATLARLVLRMQEADHFQSTMAAHDDAVMSAWWTAILIDRACEHEVRRAVKVNPRVTHWICRAAEAWAIAGGTPSAKPNSRFLRGLQSFSRPHLPPVGGTAQIEKALSTWRAWRASQGVKLTVALPGSSD